MSELLAKRIGAVTRSARLSLKLTQADVAERAGLSLEFYARIERGHSMPSAPTLFTLARQLGISLDQVVAEPSSEPSRDGPVDAMQFYRLDSSAHRRIYRRLQGASPALLRLIADVIVSFDNAVEEGVAASTARE